MRITKIIWLGNWQTWPKHSIRILLSVQHIITNPVGQLTNLGGRSPSFFSKKKVTIFSPKMVTFQVNHWCRWKYWWKKRWYFRWIARNRDFSVAFFDTIFGENFFHQIKWRFLHRKWWVFWWVTKIGEYFGEGKGDFPSELPTVKSFFKWKNECKRAADTPLRAPHLHLQEGRG